MNRRGAMEFWMIIVGIVIVGIVGFSLISGFINKGFAPVLSQTDKELHRGCKTGAEPDKDLDGYPDDTCDICLGGVDDADADADGIPDRCDAAKDDPANPVKAMGIFTKSQSRQEMCKVKGKLYSGTWVRASGSRTIDTCRLNCYPLQCK